MHLKKKKRETSLARRANPPRPTKARGLGGPKNFGGLNMLTQPVIFGEFGGPTRRVEPVLPSLAIRADHEAKMSEVWEKL